MSQIRGELVVGYDPAFGSEEGLDPLLLDFRVLFTE